MTATPFVIMIGKLVQLAPEGRRRLSRADDSVAPPGFRRIWDAVFPGLADSPGATIRRASGAKIKFRTRFPFVISPERSAMRIAELPVEMCQTVDLLVLNRPAAPHPAGSFARRHLP